MQNYVKKIFKITKKTRFVCDFVIFDFNFRFLHK